MYHYLLPLLPLIAAPPAEPRFEQETIDDQVAIGYGIAIGDVDGDGKPDILLADKKQFVWYRNGDWQKFVMVENLTEHDNVCIAARDIDGDGKVEVAVGAQWNPGETSDTSQSGSVHYLIRPEDPTQRWTPVKLHHEPTVHRMRWAKAGEDNYHLIVLPLHGKGNKDGEGEGVKVIAYEKPEDPRQEWQHWIIDESMHLTHNLDVHTEGEQECVYIGGKEGVKAFSYSKDRWRPHGGQKWVVKGHGFSEVRVGNVDAGTPMLAGIGPLHGNLLTAHVPRKGVPKLREAERIKLDEELREGHGLAVADLIGQGRDQVIAGWRNPNAAGHLGIKLYIPFNVLWEAWSVRAVDIGDMACEDLAVADLDGDGKPDIIASGRSTHNLKIYWNRSGE
ncbi:FG-GAP repeat domain-containing protein [Parapedobacter koreensis]|uniref:Repeat domain-containing protein n=1 Tax=Parapedobacter koreensis TaxID=332977 RepID=A0A1H7PW73_9SPHI|nr:VCBS repeat-containing protein [Parapedobacter koreensis]SEL39515.1 Repeat domain-containing protein [Parapedobacter koreensis]